MSRIVLYCPHCNAILIAFQEQSAKDPERLVKKLMRNPHPHDCEAVRKKQEEYEAAVEKYSERQGYYRDNPPPSEPKYGAEKSLYIMPA